MYVDFSHGNLVVAVCAAMSLFNQTNGPFDPTKPTKHRTWVISKTAPFSGHTYDRRKVILLSSPAISCRFEILTPEDVRERRQATIEILLCRSRRYVQTR